MKHILRSSSQGVSARFSIYCLYACGVVRTTMERTCIRKGTCNTIGTFNVGILAIQYVLIVITDCPYKSEEHDKAGPGLLRVEQYEKAKHTGDTQVSWN